MLLSMKGKVEDTMFVLSGKTVYSGIAKGPIHVLNRDINTIKREKIADIELELKRLDAALMSAKLQWMELYKKAVKVMHSAKKIKKQLFFLAFYIFL